MRELDFIRWVCGQQGLPGDVVPVGPGDDCAVVRAGDERIVITCDQVLDGVHFRLERDGPAAAGRKALARNLSDIAAMACVPLCAVASVALPAGCDESLAREIYQGMRTLGEETHCPIVGGDLGAWDQRLAISVTVLGRPEGIEPVLRSGGRAGDWVYVTGRLGGAWRSGRDLTFAPRLTEARLLARQYALHAMIDLSDGLATDLRHVCHASGLGAIVRAADVPIHPDARERDNPLAAALGDGEDYELLFTLAADDGRRLLADRPLDVEVTHLGELTAAGEILLEHLDGRREPLTTTGWEHTT